MANAHIDHYAVLGIPAGSSIPEIKKAYRRLAKIFHPDKTNSSPESLSKFASIKNSYEVLTDPSRKQAWLQQRWYDQSIHRRSEKPLVTAADVLLRCIELERHVSRLDSFRIDENGLCQYIMDLLDESTIERLRASPEKSTLHQIITILLRCLIPVSYAHRIPVLQQLEKLAEGDAGITARIRQSGTESKKRRDRQRYLPLWLLLLTALVALLILWAS